ncbi:MAG TPA: DUF2103 domain-containing protein [Candidatus Obscuribacter sp.]|nr:metal-binding protein [Candidatus Melainabacteria bacterium]MBK8225214.1 metal-binding protein [Candidatus Obscuribacter sp.]MBK9280631.1 metal-binding protein [Candidatus Obscuribacter sp.]MDX1986717.1 DUF2103 domain-containing protein [Candidatus Obscuribacter sp.]HMW88531.1 DUF2103 domain-containing protein [Candidatus Obscuribacter sp.]
MKYRGASKIKYQHGMIKGLREALEAIESWSEIQTIVPGEIKPCRGSGSGLRLNVKYKTAAGLKVLAKNNSSVQEVFFASNSPDALVSKLQAHKP